MSENMDLRDYVLSDEFEERQFEKYGYTVTFSAEVAAIHVAPDNKHDFMEFFHNHLMQHFLGFIAGFRVNIPICPSTPMPLDREVLLGFLHHFFRTSKNKTTPRFHDTYKAKSFYAKWCCVCFCKHIHDQYSQAVHASLQQSL